MSQSIIARAPALRPFLLRMAKRVVQGRPLPAHFSVSDLDYATQGKLECLLGVALKRNTNGSVIGAFPPHWREPLAWTEIISALGLTEEIAAKESADSFLTRLSWLEPDARWLLDGLRTIPEVIRFLHDQNRREEWKRLFMGVFGRVNTDPCDEQTLSQLGSDWLNDSKSLRTGSLRRQLFLMLSTVDGCEYEKDERTLFETYGIIENPYTSFVTFFAPLVFTTDAGETFDFPERLWSAGLSCTLTSETVRCIRSVAWRSGARVLITSENAAPFARLVATRRSALYTEGYPNHAIQRLLRLLDDEGVTAEHAGDADLDGFRIAEIISKCITLHRVVASEIVSQSEKSKGIALTETQRLRIQRFLERHPQCQHRAELSCLLAHECWHEQESFPI